MIFIEKKYRVVLAVWQPAVDINFDNPKSKVEINDAVEANNKRFRGYKTLSVVNITKSTIVLFLKIVIPEEGKVNVSREISFFSKKLFHDHRWEGLSKVPKRLFTVVEAVEINNMNENNSTNTDVDEIMGINSNINSPVTILDNNDYKLKRLKWLLATKELIETEIKILENDLRK